jgi:hypothetical protein
MKIYAGQDILHTQYNNMVDFLQDDQYGHDHSGQRDGLDWGTPIDHDHLLQCGSYAHDHVMSALPSIDSMLGMLRGVAACENYWGVRARTGQIALERIAYTATGDDTLWYDVGTPATTWNQGAHHVFTTGLSAITGAVGVWVHTATDLSDGTEGGASHIKLIWGPQDARTYTENHPNTAAGGFDCPAMSASQLFAYWGGAGSIAILVWGAA